MQHPRILKLHSVIEVTGLARSTVFAKVADKTFPAQIKLSTRSSGWIEEEVYQWVRSRIAASRGAQQGQE